LLVDGLDNAGAASGVFELKNTKETLKKIQIFYI
jgi:hypothetical protein